MTGTLLLGIGNIHREDDGVGPKCVDLVSFPGVHRLVVQQLVPELAETIRDYERVVFVDASLRGGNAELGPLLPRDTDTSFPLTHGMTCEGLLALTEALYGRVPKAFLLSIPGFPSATAKPSRPGHWKTWNRPGASWIAFSDPNPPKAPDRHRRSPLTDFSPPFEDSIGFLGDPRPGRFFGYKAPHSSFRGLPVPTAW